MNRYQLGSMLAYLLFGLMLEAQPNGKAESSEILLERAIQKQTVDGDLKAAIEIYKKILDRAGRNRPVEAKALLRLGQCQEKLGQADEVKAYDRLVREYADQGQEADAARARLAAIKATKPGELSFRRVLALTGVHRANTSSYSGRYLLDTTDNENQKSFQLHDLSTGETRKVSGGAPAEYPLEPCLSPDGSEYSYKPIATIRDNEIRVARTEGSGDRMLYKAPDEILSVYPYGFSPDGTQHLVERKHKNGPFDFAVLSSDGSPVRIFKVPGRKYLGGAAFSPDGKFIVYDALSTPNAKNHDIYIGSIESGGQTLLTDDSADDSVLGWAPDGSGILFLTDRAGTQDAYFQPLRGAQSNGSPRLVKRNIGRVTTRGLGFARDGRLFYRTEAQGRGFYLGRLNEARALEPKLAYSQDLFGGPASFPAWSPDGSKLAFRFQPEIGRPVIAIKTLSSGAVSKLPLPINVIDIEWLDNQSLLLAGSEWLRPTVVLLDSSSGQSKVLMQSEDVELRFDQLTVSSNGKHLYFRETRRREQPTRLNSRMVEWDLANSSGRTVLESRESLGVSFPLSFSVSPDGRSVARVDAGVLKIVAFSDHSSREVAQDAGEPLAWLPDGSSLLFQRNRRELWRVPATRGTPVRVGEIEAPFHQMRMHPDGQEIALLASRTSTVIQEIWVAENLLSALKAGSR